VVDEGHDGAGDNWAVASFGEETVCDREDGVSLGKGVGSGEIVGSENEVAKALNYAGTGTRSECLVTRKVSEDGIGGRYRRTTRRT
jgi:hypothetical protein